MADAVNVTPGSHLPILDGTRAVAAFMVLLTHVGAASGATERSVLGAFLARGDWGVALFFVLSGFLLTRPWVKSQLGPATTPTVRTYLRKRAVRILPAYWLALVAVLSLLPQQVTPAGVVSNFLLLQTYTGPLLTGFFQSWSLCTEVAFYLVLPLLAPLLIRRSARFALTAIGCVALVAPMWIMVCKEWAIGTLPPYAIVWLPGHLDWFCAGMALAVLERQLHAGTVPGALVGGHRWLLGAVILFALALTPLAGPIGWTAAAPLTEVTKEVLYGGSAFLLVGATLQPGATATGWGRVLNSRVMAWLGLLSYAFFLWHNLVIDLLRRALGLTFGGGGFAVTLIGATIVTLAISQASFSLLEKPLMNRWGSSRARNSKPQPEPSGAHPGREAL